MSEKAAGDSAAGATSTSSNATASDAVKGDAPKSAAAEGNPALRMMGLPRIRARLPSRNWTIFFTLTGGLTSAILYDKYQVRQNRQKWCDLVSHLGEEPIPTHQMPRKMTIYLAAPPGDGLRYAREHFHEYIKPVLVASAMDWDVVEGRKEGDVRHKTAEKVRKRRRKGGESDITDEQVGEVMVEEMRKKNGTRDWEGVGGDIVVGRHTWKEYIRGFHEGWLGPVEAPKSQDETQGSGPDVQQPPQPSPEQPVDTSATPEITAEATTEGTTPNEKTEEEKKEEEKPKPRQPPPYIQPPEYDSATLSSLTPELIGPSVGIQMPHVLGFRHTPKRIYRFLNRRHLADSIGRDVASAVLASYRPYDTVSASPSDDAGVSASAGGERQVSEASRVLGHEEQDWYKQTRRAREPHEESVWIEEVKLDERLSQRMRTFQLGAEDEDRAKRIGEGKEKVRRAEEDEG